MGLLDDAIKEHLELKRRHGGDPSEIARQEAEALGPVRRGEVDLAAPSAAPAAPAAPAEPEEPAGAVRLEDEPAAQTPRAPEPPRHEPAPEPVVHPGDHPVPDEHDVTPPHGDPLVHDEPGSRQGHEALHQPTREFSASDVADATGRPPAADPDVVPADDEHHDELEETPEFLQQTPEHDRLWFEQKPPKDFDF
ncbi:MAG: hypothetical protein HZB46_04900 [Solirubrobacterales bacterium]|nr:hypothetical protein [Solirubrobacterales bacterium]